MRQLTIPVFSVKTQVWVQRGAWVKKLLRGFYRQKGRKERPGGSEAGKKKNNLEKLPPEKKKSAFRR